MELEQAQQQNDWHQVWALSRLIAGTKLGPKKRRFQLTATRPPTLDEWIQHMGQAGPAGGMQAVPISVGGHDVDPQILTQVMQIPTGYDERKDYIRRCAERLQLPHSPAAEGLSTGQGMESLQLPHRPTACAQLLHAIAGPLQGAERGPATGPDAEDRLHLPHRPDAEGVSTDMGMESLAEDDDNTLEISVSAQALVPFDPQLPDAAERPYYVRAQED